jgi:CHASE2 domain-containing sensor protein
MNKRIVIKIGPGSLAKGYTATVQIGGEGTIPQTETQAYLPPAPNLADLYQRWQRAYWLLGLPTRLEARDGVTNVSTLSDIEYCQKLSRQLRDRIHYWLDGNEFRPIREKILEQLNPQDQARILLQTEDPLLQRLPWYELHFFERYRYAEVGISAPNYQQVSYPGTRSETVRILAVLGDATGLNTQIDKTLLQNLPNADIHFLSQPTREMFNRCLWDERGWDILFFAGHSSSRLSCATELANATESLEADLKNTEPKNTEPKNTELKNTELKNTSEASGEIALSPTDRLTIPQLKHALQKAIDRGLNTAIFNSCDGLGLAADLNDLHIPQVLVMREPVPDEVAHAFLQGFLESFSSGNSFYLSVREAREKLQGLESRFPCATWLPVIVQNLAETPPTWLSLQGKSQASSAHSSNHSAAPKSSVALSGFKSLLSPPSQVLPTPFTRKQRLRSGIGSGILVAIALSTLRFTGLLEPLELKGYDHFLRTRPPEALDSRLLIITNTADDIAARPNLTGSSSLSDETLLSLLNKLKPLSPALIGLDIYHAQSQKDPNLSQALSKTNNLIAICKVSDNTLNNAAQKAPPPEITDPLRIGANDFVVEETATKRDIVRLQLVQLEPPPNSPCQAINTLSALMAFRYLQQRDPDINSIPPPPPTLTRTFGGYHNLDTQGTQILLNYRRLQDPQQTNCGNVKETPADCLSVSEVLSKPTAQLQRYIKDRIVLIGTTDWDYAAGDRWSTPYTRNLTSLEEKTPGVFLHAQMISQLLSAVEDNRPLIDSWPDWQEILWIASWAMLGGLLGASTRWQLNLWLRLLLGEGILLLICWLWLVKLGIWIPWVPSAIALPVSAIAAQATLSTPQFRPKR